MHRTDTAGRLRRSAGPLIAIATVITLGLGAHPAAQNKAAQTFVRTGERDSAPVRPWSVNRSASSKTTSCGGGTRLPSRPTPWITRRSRSARTGSSAIIWDPACTARAFAIVHIAMFDAFNALAGGYRGYTGLKANVRLQGRELRAAIDAAVATAAHDTLAALYPSHAPGFAERLTEELDGVPAGQGKTAGAELGQRAAAAILAMRASDGSDQGDPQIPDQFLPSDQPGRWRPDPVSQVTVALGASWGAVTPFVLQSPRQFPHAEPPALDSQEYADAFNEVKTSWRRWRDHADRADQGPDHRRHLLGLRRNAGPRNTTATVQPDRARNRRREGHGRLRARPAAGPRQRRHGRRRHRCWDAKYVYQTWRPITGIREADAAPVRRALATTIRRRPATRRSHRLARPPAISMDPTSRRRFRRIESGHSAFGSTLFQMLRNFYGTDRIAFTFVSDEFNGVTADNTGKVRDRIPRSFSSLSAAEEENGQSRIYLGIHWAFDKAEGQRPGTPAGGLRVRERLPARAEVRRCDTGSAPRQNEGAPVVGKVPAVTRLDHRAHLELRPAKGCRLFQA